MTTKEQLEKKVSYLEKQTEKYSRKIHRLEDQVKNAVLVPVELLDSLLAYIDNNDSVSLKNLAGTIREIAENTQPAVFKTHRHP